MKLLSLMVVIIFVTHTSMSNVFNHNQNLESVSRRKIKSVPISEDVKTVRKSPIHNNTLSIKRLKPKPVVNTHSLRHRNRNERIHSANRRMQNNHLDLRSRNAERHSTKVYRRHRNDKNNLSSSEKNNNTSFKHPNTYINKLRSNKTYSCCNKSNDGSKTKEFDVNEQTYTQIDLQSSMKPTTHASIREINLKSRTNKLENNSLKITEGELLSNPAVTTVSAMLFSDGNSKNIFLATTTVKTKKFGRSDEVHFATPHSSGKHSTVKLATVLAVVAAMLLLPFLALWLSAVMAAARERVGNRNFYDDQEHLLATHV